MLENKSDQSVSLEEFSNLVGLPVEIIKNELFSKDEAPSDLSLVELREFMLTYLNKTMLTN